MRFEVVFVAEYFESEMIEESVRQTILNRLQHEPPYGELITSLEIIKWEKTV